VETVPEHHGLLSFVAMQQAYIAELSGTPNPSPRPIDLATLTEIPENRGGMRNSAEVILAYVLYRSGEFAAAETLLRSIVARDTRTGATNGIPISASRLARIWLVTGRLHEAEELCRQCAELIRLRGKWRFFVAGNLSIVLGDVLREWNRLDEAEAMIRAGIEDNTPWQIAHAYALGQTALARVLLAKGDPDQAHAALVQQWRLTDGRSIPPDLAAETRAVQLQIALAQGDLQAAAAFVVEWSPWSQTAGAFRSEQDLISLARAFLTIGRPEQAHDFLLPLKQGAAAGGRNRRLVEIQLLLARAQLLQGQARAAADNIAQSLVLAAGMGCVRVFWDQGTDLQHLIAAAARSNATPPVAQAWAATVVAIAGTDKGGTAHAGAASGRHAADAPVASPPAGAPLLEPLTPREREVLRLLAAGCSNQEIATELVITLHAVKKHTGNIYGKLGVASRTQAIVLARTLGLLA
jgi:LuxR family maltose regulon positive regulatory protein